MNEQRAVGEQSIVERTRVAPWALVAGALVVAVAVVPPALVAATGSLTIASLPDVVSRGLAAWVGDGATQPASELAAAAAFWREFHIAKAILAILAIGALAMLCRSVWEARRKASGPWRGFLWMLAGITSALGMALALVIAIANVQGALAPLASVVSFLPSGEPTPAMQALASDLGVEPLSAPAASLLGEFAFYHAAAAVCAGLVTVGLVLAAVQTWRRWRRRPSKQRSRLGLACVLAGFGVLAAGLALVTLANVSTALNPTPALVSFLGG